MDIAVTLIIQGVAFFLVVLVVMKWLWPPLMNILEERQKTIAAGLAAGNKAQKDLDEAKVKSQEIIREARDKATQIVDQASKRGNEIVEEAKQSAIAEGQRLKAQAQEEIQLETARVRAKRYASKWRALRYRAPRTCWNARSIRKRMRSCSTSSSWRWRMAEAATIARPYAKAAFQTARDSRVAGRLVACVAGERRHEPERAHRRASLRPRVRRG